MNHLRLTAPLTVEMPGTPVRGKPRQTPKTAALHWQIVITVYETSRQSNSSDVEFAFP